MQGKWYEGLGEVYREQGYQQSKRATIDKSHRDAFLLKVGILLISLASFVLGYIVGVSI